MPRESGRRTPPKTPPPVTQRRRRKKVGWGSGRTRRMPLSPLQKAKPPRPPPGALGVFNEMLKKSCPYHKGSMKHTLEECTMMQRYFSRDGQPKDDAKKKAIDT
jgi:hypothetical protein